MPLFIDILENKVLGREFKRSKQEGIQQGIDKGIHEGQLAMLCQQITARFGVLPAWPRKRLAGRSAAEIQDIGLRLLKAGRLEELLK